MPVEYSEAPIVEYSEAMPQTTEHPIKQQRQRKSPAFVVDDYYTRYLSSKVIIAIVGLVFGNSTMLN